MKKWKKTERDTKAPDRRNKAWQNMAFDNFVSRCWCGVFFLRIKMFFVEAAVANTWGNCKRQKCKDNGAVSVWQIFTKLKQSFGNVLWNATAMFDSILPSNVSESPVVEVPNVWTACCRGIFSPPAWQGPLISNVTFFHVRWKPFAVISAWRFWNTAASLSAAYALMLPIFFFSSHFSISIPQCHTNCNISRTFL